MIHSYSEIAPEIVLPESNREKWKNLLDCIAINGFDGISAISNLEEFQKQPKHWPEHDNIPQYCLYLGSFVCPARGPVDLYHYRDWNNQSHYSTGIVFGNEAHEYMSGWVGLRISDSEHGGKAYDELWFREYECGLLRDEWIAEEAKIALSETARKRSLDRIQQARKKKMPEISMKEWIERNPWEIMNTASVGTRCGRFPTKEEAIEKAKTYKGGIRQIDDNARRIYVHEIPNL